MKDKPHMYLWHFILPGGKPFCLSLIAITVYTLWAIWTDDHCFPTKKFVEADAVMYTSIIMGLLLVFRTNSAYDRWWEARKLWGQLVNEIRNLSIKLQEYIQVQEPEREAFEQLLINFPYTLKDHLRGYANKLPKNGNHPHSQHNPLHTARMVYHQLRAWWNKGVINDFDLIQLDQHARTLMDVCGGCERITKSPIAGSYKILIWSGLGLYFAILPWLLVPSIDYWTLLVVLISCYFVIGLELLAEEIEEPFGVLANDLPLESICKSIEKSILELRNLPGN